MVHIRPIVLLDGNDVSRYFISSHSEQTVTSSKDPGKYDLVLANVGGYFFKEGTFAPKSYTDITLEDAGQWDTAPKSKVSLEVEFSDGSCEYRAPQTIVIFRGEVQKAEADELFVKIEGSCTQGGMTCRLHAPDLSDSYSEALDGKDPNATDWVWHKAEGDTITSVVNDLLDAFGIDGERFIEPAMDALPSENFVLYKANDFSTCFDTVASTSGSTYYFDENDDFHFEAVTATDGFSNLNGVILRGSNASNVVGYANHVDVYGGTINDGDTINERRTHHTVHAHWPEDEQSAEAVAERKGRGIITAPPIVIPGATYEHCLEVAKNMYKWYLLNTDVPSIRIINKAPGLRSKVAYKPWNGNIPPVSCLGGDEAETDYVYGIVTRRIVDLSAESGFVCTLDITTNFEGMNLSPSEVGQWTYYDGDGDYVFVE